MRRPVICRYNSLSLAFGDAIALQRQFVRALIAVGAVLFITGFVSAQENKTYSASEAAKYVGETATDKITGVQASKTCHIFLNMGGRYPNQLFTAFIPKNSADEFPDSQEANGQTVSVTGKLVLYKGKPEIVVDIPSQIKKKD